MRRAIVATPVDGLGEILRDREDALLVPPRDSVSLANAIEELLLNPDKARQLAAVAQQHGRRFDIKQTVRNLEQLYDRLTQSNPARLP